MAKSNSRNKKNTPLKKDEEKKEKKHFKNPTKSIPAKIILIIMAAAFLVLPLILLIHMFIGLIRG